MEQPMQNVVEDEEEKGVEIELSSENEEQEAEEASIVAETVEVEEVSEEHDQEVAEYSDSVKKRIDKLTYKMREAERREQAALKYAESVKNELTDTKTKLSKVDNNLFSEYNTRVDSQLDRAKANLKQAHEENDTDKLIDAQGELAKLSVEAESLTRIQKEREEKQIENEATQLQSQQMQAPAPPDPKAQEWAARNKWFGDDVAMTSSAFAFHRQLVEEQGIDPATDKYYDVLDERIKDAFPHKFEQANKPVQAVAGGSVGATTVNKSKKIKLTSSQVAIAKKLGVPLAEYAKHVQQ
tara:strand:- start:1054 stop:1944 length:891 start_codon:yes stop_codon:yes gene_type:complete